MKATVKLALAALPRERTDNIPNSRRHQPPAAGSTAAHQLRSDKRQKSLAASVFEQSKRTKHQQTMACVDTDGLNALIPGAADGPTVTVEFGAYMN